MALTALGNQLEGLVLGEADYVAFNSTQSTLRRPRSKIPRYLFRVFTPNSRGVTTKSWTKSMDARYGHANCTVDVFARSDKAQTAEMINRHLRWWRGDDDNLVSWTSSLLFALVYIFHLRANKSDRSKFEDIFLCVVETREFPDEVFIRDMDLVEAFREECKLLPDFERMRRRYYFGEYLTQGALKIEGRCQIVSAQLVIESGLYNIRSEFQGFASWEAQEKPPWAKPVVALRESYNSDKAQRQEMSHNGVEAALAIGQLFGAPWRLPIAVSLVALAPPRTDSNATLVAFRSKSFTKSNFEGDYLLPEVNEYKDIMKSIYKDYYLSEFKECLGSAEIALRQMLFFALNEDFVTHETSRTETSFSLVDVSHDAMLGKLRTISYLSDLLQKRFSTNEKHDL